VAEDTLISHLRAIGFHPSNTAPHVGEIPKKAPESKEPVRRMSVSSPASGGRALEMSTRKLVVLGSHTPEEEELELLDELVG
jgi:hypothetical protein